MARIARRATGSIRIALLVSLVALAFPVPTTAQAVVTVGNWFIGFNVTLPPFSDVLARKAVAMGVDRSRLASEVGLPLANGFDPPGCLGYDPAARVHPYDPGRAREALAQAGVKADDLGELGLWVLSLVPRRDKGRRELDILVENLTAIGLKVTVREFGNYDALERIATMPVVRMSYWGIRWNTAGCSRETFTEYLVHSRGGDNYFGYRNQEIDSLIERARSASDYGTKASLYKEVQQKILDDAVLIPIWWYGR